LQFVEVRTHCFDDGLGPLPSWLSMSVGDTARPGSGTRTTVPWDRVSVRQQYGNKQRDEVDRLIVAAPNQNYQTALSIAYGTGLRVSEAIALKVSDTDSQRMMLRVEQGKGQQGPLREVLAGAARAAAFLVARSPCPGQDVAQAWASMPPRC
jgi:hypothetical protein